MTADEMEQLARRIAERVIGAMGAVQARTLTYKDAAAQLRISVRQVKRLVASGELATCLVGKRRMVPRSEVDRVAQPTVPAKRPTKGRPKAAAYNAAEEARKVRERKRR